MRPLGSGVARASAALPRRPLLSNNPTRGNLVLSLSVILLVACTPVVALSVRANTLTFGESGRLNYLW